MSTVHGDAEIDASLVSVDKAMAELARIDYASAPYMGKVPGELILDRALECPLFDLSRLVVASA